MQRGKIVTVWWKILHGFLLDASASDSTFDYRLLALYKYFIDIDIDIWLHSLYEVKRIVKIG